MRRLYGDVKALNLVLDVCVFLDSFVKQKLFGRICKVGNVFFFERFSSRSFLLC